MKKFSKREKFQMILCSVVVLTIVLSAILVFMSTGRKNEPQPRLTSPTLAVLEKDEIIPFDDYVISVNATHENPDVEFVYAWQIDGEDYDFGVDAETEEPININTPKIDFHANTVDDFTITCEVVATLEDYADSEPAVFTLNLTVVIDFLDPPSGNISISPNPNPNN